MDTATGLIRLDNIMKVQTACTSHYNTADKITSLLTHTLPLERLGTALGMLDSGSGRQMKLLLDHR